MVFGVLLYFVLVTAVLAVLFLPPVRAWASARARQVLATGRGARERVAALGQSGARQVSANVAPRSAATLRWTRTNSRWIAGSAAVLAAGPLLALALRGMFQLDGFDHTAAHRVNEQIAALLHGEQLVPPPALPPELFTTRELEHARPMIRYASREWELLDEEFRQRLLLVFKLMREKHGYEMVLLEGYRSPERQSQLAALGSHVTQARAFESYHQYGLAADCAFLRNGKIVVSEQDAWAARNRQRRVHDKTVHRDRRQDRPWRRGHPGVPTTDTAGVQIARVGDQVTCPRKGHGRVTVIASGDPTCIIDGQPAARHGDKTACGATLLSSQALTTD